VITFASRIGPAVDEARPGGRDDKAVAAGGFMYKSSLFLAPCPVHGAA